MTGGNFIVSVPGDGRPLFFVCQIMIDLVQQIRFTLIIDKIFSGYEIIQKVSLKVGEQETAAAHNIESAERDAAFDAAQ